MHGATQPAVVSFFFLPRSCFRSNVNRLEFERKTVNQIPSLHIYTTLPSAPYAPTDAPSGRARVRASRYVTYVRRRRLIVVDSFGTSDSLILRTPIRVGHRDGLLSKDRFYRSSLPMEF
jgi:hypothetical protein